MENHINSYNLVNTDTDAVTINKLDGSVFSSDEVKRLTIELNSLFPEHIKWEFEFNAQCVIVFKAKNYIIHDPLHKNPKKRLIKKGSALKSATKETVFKKFSDEMILAILEDKTDFVSIYHKYVNLCMNVTKENVKDFASKKSISKKVMENDRTNEVKIRETIKGTDYRVGDKIWLIFKEDESLCLIENFDGQYDKMRLLEKLYKCTKLFDSVIDTSVFINYKLKKNKPLLEELLK